MLVVQPTHLHQPTRAARARKSANVVSANLVSILPANISQTVGGVVTETGLTLRLRRCSFRTLTLGPDPLQNFVLDLRFVFDRHTPLSGGPFRGHDPAQFSLIADTSLEYFTWAAEISWKVAALSAQEVGNQRLATTTSNNDNNNKKKKKTTTTNNNNNNNDNNNNNNNNNNTTNTTTTDNNNNANNDNNNSNNINSRPRARGAAGDLVDAGDHHGPARGRVYIYIYIYIL